MSFERLLAAPWNCEKLCTESPELWKDSPASGHEVAERFERGLACNVLRQSYMAAMAFIDITYRVCLTTSALLALVIQIEEER